MRKILVALSFFLVFTAIIFPWLSREFVEVKINNSNYRIVYQNKRYSLFGIMFKNSKIYLDGNYLAHFDYLRVGSSPLMYVEAVGTCGRDYLDAKFFYHKTIFISKGIRSYCLSYSSNVYFRANYDVDLTSDGIFGKESFNDLLINGSFFKKVSLILQGNRGSVALYCSSDVRPDYVENFIFSYDTDNPLYNKIQSPIVLSCQSGTIKVSGNVLTPIIN